MQCLARIDKQKRLHEPSPSTTDVGCFTNNLYMRGLGGGGKEIMIGRKRKKGVLSLPHWIYVDQEGHLVTLLSSGFDLSLHLIIEHQSLRLGFRIVSQA